MNDDDDAKIIGMTFDEAKAHLKPLDLRVRATSMDGKPCLGTRDYRTDRLNVTVVAGKITSVGGRG